MPRFTLAALFLLAPFTTLTADEPRVADEPTTAVDPAKPAVAEDGTQKAIRISKETTRLLEPLDDEGYVDYVRAVHERAFDGVTPENNFEVVARRVLGPAEIGDNAEAYHEALGIPVPPADGDYYVNLHRFADYESMSPADRKTFDEEYDALLDRPWKSADHPRAAKWLKSVDAHLDRIAEGTKRPKNAIPYLAPENAENEGSPAMIAILLPSVQSQRELTRALSIRAMHRLGEGDTDAAWSDLQAIHRQARHVDNGFTLIEGLVAIALDNIAFQGDRRVLASDLTPDQLDRYHADLVALPKLERMADKIDRGERLVGLDAVQTFARHGVEELVKLSGMMGESTTVTGQLVSGVLKGMANGEGGPTIDWNVTLEMMNDEYDRLVAAGREPDLAKRLEMFEAIEVRLKEQAVDARSPTAMLAKVVFSGEPRKAMGRMMGTILTSLLLPAVAQATAAEDRGDANLAVARIGFALRAYHAERGEYPETLSALAPKYLAEIPVDPFTAKPLVYVPSKKGFLVYSVGMNREDDAGRGYDDRTDEDRESDDLAVRYAR